MSKICVGCVQEGKCNFIKKEKFLNKIETKGKCFYYISQAEKDEEAAKKAQRQEEKKEQAREERAKARVAYEREKERQETQPEQQQQQGGGAKLGILYRVFGLNIGAALDTAITMIIIAFIIFILPLIFFS